MCSERAKTQDYSEHGERAIMIDNCNRLERAARDDHDNLQERSMWGNYIDDAERANEIDHRI